MSSAVLRRRPDLRDFQIFKEADASEERRTADTLRHQIEWREYANSGYLNDAELGLILDYDKQSAEDQDDLLDELGLEYARFFVAALQKIHKERTIMYLLALVHQMLDRNPVARARDFKRLIEEGVVGGDGSAAAAAAAGGAAAAPDVAASPYQPFLRILQQPTSDEFAVTKACKSLAILISYSDVDSLAPVSQEAAAREARARQVIEESVHRFVGWLVDRLLADKKAQLVSVVRALKTVLKSRMVQHVFVSENGLRALMTLVRKEVTNTQLLYNLCFCIWLMSFNEDLYADLAEQRAVAAIMDALRVVFREKVVRICLATLRNLLGKAAFNDRMIINGAMKLFPTLAARKWTDEDLVEDLEAIDEALQHHVSLLSSFDTYQTEVESGRLQWTPVHAEKFWRENVHRFEEHNFQLIQTLVNLLDSQDELTLAVCCYDLGEFARFHPDGRRLLDRFHGKSKLMIKMQSTSAQVAKQALLAVQKIMVHNWDALNASMSDSTGKKN